MKSAKNPKSSHMKLLLQYLKPTKDHEQSRISLTMAHDKCVPVIKMPDLRYLITATKIKGK